MAESGHCDVTWTDLSLLPLLPGCCEAGLSSQPDCYTLLLPGAEWPQKHWDFLQCNPEEIPIRGHPQSQGFCAHTTESEEGVHT